MTGKTRKTSPNQIYYEVRLEEPVIGYTDMAIYVWTNEMCDVYASDDATVFFPVDVIKTPYHGDCDVTHKWQSRDDDRRTPNFSFYAHQSQYRACSIHTLNQIAKLARRLDKKIEEVKENWNAAPKDVFNALEQLKAREIFYDKRVAGHVTGDQIMPEYMRSWRDDWKTMRRDGGCTVACFAENATEAQRIIGAKLAKRQDDGELLTTWCNHGRPVLDVGYDAPDATPARDRYEAILTEYQPEPEVVMPELTDGTDPAWDEIVS